MARPRFARNISSHGKNSTFESSREDDSSLDDMFNLRGNYGCKPRENECTRSLRGDMLKAYAQLLTFVTNLMMWQVLHLLFEIYTKGDQRSLCLLLAS